MKTVKNIVSKLNRQFFNTINKNRLIYNTCWEDPAIDRRLLGLNSSSRMVMLTSAGDNALNYLLDNPAQIHCVDINLTQNALLHLKKSIFTEGTYSLLWSMFGKGSLADASRHYRRRMRPAMPAASQIFWDQHLAYFDPSRAGSFYHCGTSGMFASLIVKRFLHKGLYRSVRKLIESDSLAEQQYYFDEIEPELWSSFLRWLIEQDATLALLGVPKMQRALIDRDASSGLTDFIHQSIKQVFTKRELKDNYFWRVYLTGCYTPCCCPAYLKEKNYSIIQQRVERLFINTSSLVNYLRANDKTYSHFVLLDHQDWLAHYRPQKLAREWKLILARARRGAKILFRSAGRSRSFLPEFIYRHVHFDERARRLHATDRVGTYGSTHLAIVDKPLRQP